MWAANSHVSPFQAAYAAHFLTEAKDKGYSVPPELLDRSLVYLNALAAGAPGLDAPPRVQAYAIYVLTRNGRVTTPLINGMRARLEKNGDKSWRKDLTAAYLASSYSMLHLDGQADSQHRVSAREVELTLEGMEYKGTSLKGPGAEGIFGNMTFSHEIVHHIGGQADTNRNTTQRILLLLEAAPLRASSDDRGGPFERIVRQILNRYLVSDSNFHSQTDHQSRIPRFLLNDIVRYWRTLCVDFAYKDWEQAGKKWAIRNIKLRTSRKLLFVAGLLTVFSCFKNESLQRDGADSGNYLLKLQEHLLNFVHSTPLNILVWTLANIGLEDACSDFLDCYEQFLAQINDKATRDHLADLSEESVYDDKSFLNCRDISHKLQATLKKVCFEIDSPLREFTYEYGVF